MKTGGQESDEGRNVGAVFRASSVAHCDGTSSPAANPRVIRGYPANLSGFAPKHGPLRLARVAAIRSCTSRGSLR